MRRLSSLPKEQRSECMLALCELCEAFGQPHLHSGLSIRKLKEKTFVCRGNLSLRFVFYDQPDNLYVSFLGNHDEVRAGMKSGKFY